MRANKPVAASYTPSALYQYNSTLKKNTVTRSATGTYTVRFPGLQSAGGGTVDVTAVNTSGYCKVAGWGPAGTAVNVSVLCFNAGGAAKDSQFDAIFAAPAVFTPANLSYVWANQPTAASYTPSLPYQYNSGGGTDTITRSGTGSYTTTPSAACRAGVVHRP